ncbi:MAG: histone deacetylase, partial [Deltaproteobacteria bacterium]
MIIYDEKQKFSLLEFGIEIPVYDSRARKTFEKLINHPIIGPQISEWRVAKTSERISKSDLLRVHSQDYINRLYSTALEKEIVKTFELVDDRGRYFRYSPRKATL